MSHAHKAIKEWFRYLPKGGTRKTEKKRGGCAPKLDGAVTSPSSRKIGKKTKKKRGKMEDRSANPQAKSFRARNEPSDRGTCKKDHRPGRLVGGGFDDCIFESQSAQTKVKKKKHRAKKRGRQEGAYEKWNDLSGLLDPKAPIGVEEKLRGPKFHGEKRAGGGPLPLLFL